MFPSQFANIFLTYQTFVTNLHLLRAELRCKLQEKLHRVTGSQNLIQVKVQIITMNREYHFWSNSTCSKF